MTPDETSRETVGPFGAVALVSKPGPYHRRAGGR